MEAISLNTDKIIPRYHFVKNFTGSFAVLGVSINMFQPEKGSLNEMNVRASLAAAQ